MTWKLSAINQNIIFPNFVSKHTLDIKEFLVCFWFCLWAFVLSLDKFMSQMLSDTELTLGPC